MNKDLNEQYSHILDIIYNAKKLGDLNPKTVKEMYARIHSQSEVQTIIEGIDVMISKYRNELRSRIETLSASSYFKLSKSYSSVQ